MRIKGEGFRRRRTTPGTGSNAVSLRRCRRWWRGPALVLRAAGGAGAQAPRRTGGSALDSARVSRAMSRRPLGSRAFASVAGRRSAGLPVVFDEDGRDLGPRELRGWRDAPAQHFTDSRPGQENEILGCMVFHRAHRHDPLELAGPGGVVAPVDLYLEGAGGNVLVENALGVEGTVVVPDAGVVPPDDEMGAARVLAEYGVQHRLAGPA